MTQNDTPRVRILLIDDDEDSFIITRELLADLDDPACELDWASKYDDGLERVCAEEHDVYLLDYRLGPRDGIELLKSALEAGVKRPIIMRTGQDDFAIDRQAMRLGAADYLVKGTITSNELDRAIRHAMERHKLHEELEHSNRELEQFAFAAAHDLRAPLRQVSSFCQLLSRRYNDALDHTGQEWLDLAVDGVGRMDRLITDLLAYSKASKAPIALSHVDLGEVLRLVKSNLGGELDESAGRIEHGPLPTVPGEFGQLERLLQNLISNALAYRGDEAPVVEITVTRRDDAWEFAVRNNGVGVHADDLERIFEMFQRADGQSAHEGTGLGLPICARIVERHGGRMWVESEPGVGSTFFFTLAPKSD